MKRPSFAPVTLALALTLPAMGCRAMVRNVAGTMVGNKIERDLEKEGSPTNCEYRKDKLHCVSKKDGASLEITHDMRTGETTTIDKRPDGSSVECTEVNTSHGALNWCRITILDPSHANEAREKIRSLGFICTGETVIYEEINDRPKRIISC